MGRHFLKSHLHKWQILETRHDSQGTASRPRMGDFRLTAHVGSGDPAKDGVHVLTW